jgi:hypothetical protein
MWISKKKFKYLQALILANSAMLTALTQQLDNEGKLNGDKVMKLYEEGMNELKEMIKYEVN